VITLSVKVRMIAVFVQSAALSAVPDPKTAINEREQVFRVAWRPGNARANGGKNLMVMVMAT
jgi:hypothetical protein